MSAVHILFNLYPGEAKRAQLFVIFGLLWSFGTYGMFTLSEGTFLEHVGSQALPSCYVMIAIGLCMLSGILIFLLNKIPIRHLLGGLIALWSCVLFTFYLLYALTPLPLYPSYWFAFRVMGWIIPISSYICFWAFVDQYFDLQDGKRFFSFFNSFLLLGDFLAAAMIALTVRHVGVSPLMLVLGIAILSALPLILLISRTTKPLLDEHLDHLDAPPPLTLKQTLKTIINSRFTLVLLLFYLVMQLLNVVTEFNYMEGFENAFRERGEHELTSFIGSCSMWISFVNMLLGFLIYGRILKKLGINNIILIAPTVFLLLFCFWFWRNGLTIAIFGMVAREGMSYVMDDNNLNLLLSGVPTKIKNQIRITVESFFEPAGMILSALLLFCFHKHSLILGIVVASVAFLIVLFVRYHYPKAIFLNLVAHSIRFGKKAVDWIQKGERKEVEFRLLSHLRGGPEKGQLLAFEYLLKLDNPKLLGHLLNHINLLSLPGKISAIELLSESSAAKEPIVVERLERLRRFLPYPTLRSAIHFYFARQGLFRPEKVLHDLQSEDLGLRSAAILTLKTSPFVEQLPTFCQLAEEQLQALLNSPHEEELCAGLEILGLEGRGESVEQLFPYLTHSSMLVNRASAQAISRVAHPDWQHFGVKLASRLCYTHDPKSRFFCLKAIEIYQNPDSIIPLITNSIHFSPGEKKLVEAFALEYGKAHESLLLALVKQRAKHERCRLLAGKILAKLNPKLLREHIGQIVHQEVLRAYYYFFHSHTIQKQEPQQDLSLLTDALLTGYHSVVDFIIQLVGAANEIEECEVLTMSLRSSNKKIRAQAFESLEKTAPHRLFQLFLPLLNENEEIKVRNFLSLGGSPLSLTQLLDKMAESASPTDRIVSAGLKAKLNIPNWQEEWQINGKELLEHLVTL